MGVPVVLFAGDTFHSARLGAVPACRRPGRTDLRRRKSATSKWHAPWRRYIGQLNEIRQSLASARGEQSEMFDAPRFAAWFEDQVVEMVKDIKPLPQPVPRRKERGLLSVAPSIPSRPCVLSVAAHMHMREYAPLRNVLERPRRRPGTATGVVAYEAWPKSNTPKAVMPRRSTCWWRRSACARTRCALYRKLGIWMDEQSLDKSALAQLLDDQFGLALETLEASPPPTVFEILGITVEHEDNPAAEEATA